MKYINDPETVMLAKNGDKDAMEAILVSNMGLIKSLALRFAGRGVDTEDLIQLGSIGLIKAVRGFDESYGCNLSTYAVPMITGEIKRFLRDDGTIKVSRSVKRNAAIIKRFCDEFSARNGREPILDEISSGCEIEYEDIVTALEARQPILSLYSPDDDSGSLEDIVGEDDMEENFDKIALREAIAALDCDERRLIELRYYRGLTQQQIAKLLGWSQVKVSREERRVREKLAKSL